ncbi:MerR family transcriptional regulator [Nocardia alba]|uniref:DNA-binding transcriptional MerR regulator n=1 Tax=Nocardia alba TaxID=225051 RepID=A0A4R1FT30_9NOCA|nr:MerR family transcriptional regulator [Nocardia alba]TCJ95648.1 DNA-binding transcriptional MerR regulator [Nocardia alba]
MTEQQWTIAQASALTGLPESTLRYWERIRLVSSVTRDRSSGHRRYSEDDIDTLDTLGNLRAVGMSVADMRRYLAARRRGDAAAGEQKALFRAHAQRLAEEIEVLELRRRYLELKVRYWAAREAGDLDGSAVIADLIRPLIDRVNLKETT